MKRIDCLKCLSEQISLLLSFLERLRNNKQSKTRRVLGLKSQGGMSKQNLSLEEQTQITRLKTVEQINHVSDISLSKTSGITSHIAVNRTTHFTFNARFLTEE